MGQCVSSGGAASEATVSAAPAKAATALVLLPAGELREYSRPATAARVLQDLGSDGSESEGWFLCDSDRMGFEGAVAAVGKDDELRAGRIYFVLPAEARRRGLRREEVAALAVKASHALATRAAAASSGTTGRRRRGGAAVAPLLFSPTEDDEEEEEAVHAAQNTAQTVGKRRSPARSRSTQRRFAPDLTAIPECEMSE